MNSSKYSDTQIISEHILNFNYFFDWNNVKITLNKIMKDLFLKCFVLKNKKKALTYKKITRS